MNLLSRSAACMLAVVASAPAAIAQSVRPGLWEIQRSTTSTSGVQMSSASAASMSARVCLTPEMAQHNETAEELLPGCQTTTQSRSASGVKLAFTCTNPRQSGETEISYQGPKAYSMRTIIHREGNGTSETVTKTGSGKWVSDDCGGVTPLPAQR